MYNLQNKYNKKKQEQENRQTKMIKLKIKYKESIFHSVHNV